MLRRTILALALVGASALASWRWWIAPRREAAAASAELIELRERTSATLGELGIATPLDDHRAELRWRAPGECVEVYRVRVDEQHRDESVAVFLGRAEEHRTYYLALAGDSRRSPSDALAPAIATLTSDGEQIRERELWFGPAQVGPSAPDLACRRRTWDPLEDALALGWAKLPDRSVAVGERWTGAAVEGRCHETVCVEPDASFGHAVPCRARPWSEQLAGADGELALIRGDWDDGHDPARAEIGILTSRELVLDEGRPLFVRAVIDERWAGVRRELSLVRVDDCGARSLSAGDPVAETRAQFREQIHARLSRPATD